MLGIFLASILALDLRQLKTNLSPTRELGFSAILLHGSHKYQIMTSFITTEFIEIKGGTARLAQEFSTTFGPLYT